MSNRRLAIAVLVVALLVGAAGLVAVLWDDSTGDGGGPAPLPSAQEQDAPVSSDVSATIESEDASATMPGRVDPSVTVGDPVPDDLLQEFFGMIESAGATPIMNETYTIEFVGTTDNVRIEGRFEEGSQAFDFEFDDGLWKLETSL